MTDSTGDEPETREADQQAKSFRPLSGVRVLDFSKILAGPLCSQYLADLGADVIKVEPPKGDDTRHWPPFENGIGTIFLAVNRNKRSITLDLRSKQGLEAAHRLARKADIVLESFGPGAADRLGVGYETVKDLNPLIVYASISGYGTRGPMKGEKGYDLIAQAFCGMLSLTGAPGGPPARSPFSPVDQATGLHAVIGLMGGLMQRDKTGRGVKIETSLFDSAVGFLGYFLQSYWQRGTEPARLGSGHESLCPYQAFDTADRPIILGIANDSLWQTFCKIANEPELAKDPHYTTGTDRVERRDEVVGRVSEILKTRKREDWLTVLSAHSIPCSPVHTLAELSAHPHTEEAGMILQSDAFKTVASPMRAAGERLPLNMKPPSLGEHSSEILKEIGYESDEVEKIVAANVLNITARPQH